MEIEEYFRARGDQLLRFAYLMTGDRAAAEDVVQDVLCSVIARWRFVHRDVDNLDAYLRRAVLNRRNSWLRRRARQVPIASADMKIMEPDPPFSDRVDLWRALQRLPVRQRSALVLRFYEDLPYSEIGAALGCQVGTARSLVSRGLKEIRPFLLTDEERGIHK